MKEKKVASFSDDEAKIIGLRGGMQIFVETLRCKIITPDVEAGDTVDNNGPMPCTLDTKLNELDAKCVAGETFKPLRVKVHRLFGETRASLRKSQTLR